MMVTVWCTNCGYDWDMHWEDPAVDMPFCSYCTEQLGFEEIEMSNDRLFTDELEGLINKYCVENESNTPDYLLARYLMDALRAYERVVKDRDNWFGFEPFGGIHATREENKITQ